MDAGLLEPNVVVESEAGGNTIESLIGPSWETPSVAAVEDGGQTSCTAVKDESSSSCIQSESIDGGLVNVGEVVVCDELVSNRSILGAHNVVVAGA